MPQNPYPTQPGFGLRVHHAMQALKKLAAEPWNRGLVNTRGFDNCFENFDGAAVVWALMHAAQTDSALAEGIAVLGGPSGSMQEHWRRVYRGSTRDNARQLSLF
jgi:hypothetical protein